MKSKFMNLDESELAEMISYEKMSGYSMNDRDENGDTYLHYCIKNGFRNLVKLMCNSGANIYVKNSEGKRAIDIAWEDKGGHDMLGLILWHSPLATSQVDLSASFVEGM